MQIIVLPNSLHNTALLIRDISHPIRFARRAENMSTPTLNMPIKLIIFINVEFPGVLDRATFTVPRTFFTVYFGIGLREQLGRRFGCAETTAR